MSETPEVDLVILGGGINGAGVAYQAAQARLSVALFEKGDFASGTSSKSTKLIHGGIRYLEQFHFSLVFESLRERYRLLQTAPHLVRPLSFLLPCYGGDRNPPWMLKIGLWLYDILAGAHRIAFHQWLDKEQSLKKAPFLKTEGLLGCGVYFDAQVNDARLVLENILGAEEKGASCWNYRSVTQLNKSEDGYHVFFKDEKTGESGVLKARCLLNATGPWANQTAKILGEDGVVLVRPTRGSHIIVPQVISDHAVLITTAKDNRIIFVIPWQGFSLVGTTDLDDSTDPDHAIPTEEEIQYLLTEAGRVFPGQAWERSSVISAFTGLRPLAFSTGNNASAVSREDRILAKGRLVTIVGGKLTTYRSMAERAVQKIMVILGKSPAPSASDRLPGTPSVPLNEFLNAQKKQASEKYFLGPDQVEQLVGLYGQRASKVLKLLEENPAWAERLVSNRPEILAQVVFAVREEKAVHLDDVLIRRLEIGYSPERWGEASQKAAQCMAAQLGWSEPQVKDELSRYRHKLFPTPTGESHGPQLETQSE
jgi:glycerol-3-phosphate dehydrogenase